MGKATSRSVIGDYTGKVGPVIFSTWLDISTVKAFPARKKNYKLSEKQTHQVTVFSRVTDFLLPVQNTINIGFQQPKKAKMTALNKATSYHLLNAVVGEPSEPCLDLAKIKLSWPIKSTQAAWNAALIAEEGRKVTVKWELNPFPQKCTQLNDQVSIVFYDKELNWYQEILPGNVTRSTLSYTYTVQEKCIGHDIFAYMFLISADKKLVSETEYLGVVKVLA